MEELLFIVVQLFGEVLLELLIEGICYLATGKTLSKQKSEGGFGVGLPIAYGLIGGLLGACSVALWSHSILSHNWLRISNLLVTPVLIGWFGIHCVPRPQGCSDRLQFSNGFCFALAFAGARFVLAR